MDFTKLFEELSKRDDEGRRFYTQIQLQGEYELVRHESAHTVIDLGANVGNFSYYIYDNADSIYAIEANEGNFKQLSGYVTKYRLDKIHPFHLAIAGSNGKRDLYPSGGCGGYTLEPNEQKIAESVQTQTLATFLEEQKIGSVDILKIDVEGAEEEIFADQSFPLGKIRYIIGENHGKNLKPILEDKGYIYAQADNIFIAYH